MTRCPICSTLIDPKYGRKYCSNKCNQQSYRTRNADKRKESLLRYSQSEKNRLRKLRNKQNAGSIYSDIKKRCENSHCKEYKWYGQRGIQLKLTKQEFINIYFESDVCKLCNTKLQDTDRRKTDGRTIDRIDSNGHYEVENVRVVCKGCNTKQRNAQG